MFEPKENFPVLRGKAAEMRHFAGPLRYAFERYMDEGDVQHKHVHALLVAAERMEAILDEHIGAYRLPAPASTEYRDNAIKYVQLTAALGQYFHNAGVMLFHYTIKNRYLMHLALICKYVNPRLAWCYSGEAMMNRVKIII